MQVTDEMQRSMGRVESKVDILLERSDHFEKRLAAVERRVWYASGASAILAYITTFIIGKH